MIYGRVKRLLKKYIYELASICFTQSKLVFDNIKLLLYFSSLTSSTVLLQFLNVLKCVLKRSKFGRAKEVKQFKKWTHYGVKYRISKILTWKIMVIFMLVITIYTFHIHPTFLVPKKESKLMFQELSFIHFFFGHLSNFIIVYFIIYKTIKFWAI